MKTENIITQKRTQIMNKLSINLKMYFVNLKLASRPIHSSDQQSSYAGAESEKG